MTASIPALQPKPIKQSQVTMTEMVLPQHTNALGSVFGGTVMSWVDIAAATCANHRLPIERKAEA